MGLPYETEDYNEAGGGASNVNDLGGMNFSTLNNNELLKRVDADNVGGSSITATETSIAGGSYNHQIKTFVGSNALATITTAYNSVGNYKNIQFLPDGSIVGADGINIQSVPSSTETRVGINVPDPEEALDIEGNLELRGSSGKIFFKHPSGLQKVELDADQDGTNGGKFIIKTKVDNGNMTEKLIINNAGATTINGVLSSTTELQTPIVALTSAPASSDPVSTFSRLKTTYQQVLSTDAVSQSLPNPNENQPVSCQGLLDCGTNAVIASTDAQGRHTLPPSGSAIYSHLVANYEPLGGGGGGGGGGGTFTDPIAIGTDAGLTNQGIQSVAVGAYSGSFNQGIACVAIGYETGKSNQGIGSISIGRVAGQTNQQTYAVAVGENAGRYTQRDYCVAVGHLAGNQNQATRSVAIGRDAGSSYQQVDCVAIGDNAGRVVQGSTSVAIGKRAGENQQHNNTIVLNAQGTALDTTASTGFYVAPIASGTSSNILYYDTTTKQITYGANTSDDRLKINETPITGALELINSLNYYEYDKVKTLDGTDITHKERGVIAQHLVNTDLNYILSGGNTETIKKTITTTITDTETTTKTITEIPHSETTTETTTETPHPEPIPNNPNNGTTTETITETNYVPYGLRYNDLFITLCSAVKELSAEVSTLKQRVITLESAN